MGKYLLESLQTNFLEGLQVVGICTVFVILLLALLLFFLYSFGFLFKNKESETQFIAPDGRMDPHIVAAITACINFFYETKKPEEQIEFVVRSIKRKQRP